MLLVVALALLLLPADALQTSLVSKCPNVRNSVCAPCEPAKHPDCAVIAKLNMTNGTECCDACLSTPGCRFWTLNERPGEGLCILKTAETPSESGECISGAVPAPPAPPPTPPPPGAKNHIFFVVDDLRNELGFTNNRNGIVTPNIDQLAKEGLVLDHAYVQIGVCSPSRNSFLSGRRPDTTKIWNFKESFRVTLGDNISSLPEVFKLNGYVASGMGKVYHPGHPKNDDEPLSWSQDYPYFHPKDFLSPAACAEVEGSESGHQWCACDSSDSSFQDGQIADKAVERLNDFKKTGTPFFLAVGLHKPHIPWVFPKRFLDQQIPLNSTDVATHLDAPTDMPPVAFYECDNIDSHIGPDTPLPHASQQAFRRAYRGAMSWTDHLVGKVLTTLKELNLEETTSISFLGDHGWQLGEHGEWCKQTNFDLVARVPMIVKVPWISTATGRSDAFVEAVDLYPTLAALHGLEAHFDAAALEGFSFLPVIHAPATPWKNATFTQYPRCGDSSNACTSVDKTDFVDMGYSIRTAKWRYTRWMKWDGKALAPVWDEVVGEELYDHTGDDGMSTDAFENENVAAHTSNAAVKARLAEALKLGWKAALPV